MHPDIEKLRKRNAQWRKPWCLLMLIALWALLGVGMFLVHRMNDERMREFPEPYGALVGKIAEGTMVMMYFSVTFGFTIGVYVARRFSTGTSDLVVMIYDEVEAIKQKNEK